MSHMMGQQITNIFLGNMMYLTHVQYIQIKAVSTQEHKKKKKRAMRKIKAIRMSIYTQKNPSPSLEHRFGHYPQDILFKGGYPNYSEFTSATAAEETQPQRREF